MYILLDACQHPTILRVLYFAYLFWEILAVLIPIGLIVMLMIDFTKAVVISKEDEQVKSMKLVGKRIMYAVFIFATPWLVSVVMGVLGDIGVELGGDYTLCINTVKNISAGTDNIERYDKLLKIEEAKDKQNRNNNNRNNTGTVTNNGQQIANNLVNLAKGEIGHVGGNKYSRQADSVPWCAFFTVWTLKNTKYDSSMNLYQYINKEGLITSDGLACGTMPAFRSSNRTNFKFYKSKYYGGDYTPKKGDIIYFWDTSWWGFEWDGRNSANHVGIVDYVAGSQVFTVEGNVSGANSTGSATNVVGTIGRSLNSERILGYGSWYQLGTNDTDQSSSRGDHTSGGF